MPPDAGHGRSAALAPIQPWSSWQRLTIRSTEGLSHPGFLQRAPLFEGGHSLLFKTSQWLKRFVRPVPCSPWQGGGEDRGHGVPQSKTTISLAPLVPEGANQKIFAANLGRKSILEAETSRVSHMLEDGGGGGLRPKKRRLVPGRQWEGLSQAIPGSIQTLENLGDVEYSV